MKETTRMGDDALVHGCLNGEAAAWAELHCLVRRLAGGLAGARFHLDVGMIEDVTQSTLENLLAHDCRALRAFRGASALSTYVGAIILSVATRQNKPRQREEPLCYIENNSPPPPHNYVDVDDLLRGLSPREQLIVRLDLERYTAPEIADLLSRTGGKPVTAAAIRKCLERARRTLRGTLEPLRH
jgi:DNA-directed RNA polymerase specialized sigma24 family protein